MALTGSGRCSRSASSCSRRGFDCFSSRPGGATTSDNSDTQAPPLPFSGPPFLMTCLLAAWLRCWCNGRSRYCLRDTWGLHCVDCQGNTEGRHCERCKDGFYQEGAGLSCTPCRCHALGERPPRTHTHTLSAQSLITWNCHAQGRSMPPVTAEGAAAARKVCQERNATSVRTEPLDPLAAPKGEDTPHPHSIQASRASTGAMLLLYLTVLSIVIPSLPLGGSECRQQRVFLFHFLFL